MHVQCILVVEDESILAWDLEATLQNAGFQVLGPAATAREALELAAQTHPDLALVDINLADGKKTGIEAARRLQAQYHTPSLFLSGQGTEARQNKDAALGLLEKPYSPDAVVESVAVAEAVLAGEMPPRLPPGLELFSSS